MRFVALLHHQLRDPRKHETPRTATAPARSAAAVRRRTRRPPNAGCRTARRSARTARSCSILRDSDIRYPLSPGCPGSTDPIRSHRDLGPGSSSLVTTALRSKWSTRPLPYRSQALAVVVVVQCGGYAGWSRPAKREGGKSAPPPSPVASAAARSAAARVGADDDHRVACRRAARRTTSTRLNLTGPFQPQAAQNRCSAKSARRIALRSQHPARPQA